MVLVTTRHFCRSVNRHSFLWLVLLPLLVPSELEFACFFVCLISTHKCLKAACGTDEGRFGHLPHGPLRPRRAGRGLLKAYVGILFGLPGIIIH